MEFDVIKGKGPRIESPLRDMASVRALRPLEDPSTSLPFTAEILSSLRCVLCVVVHMLHLTAHEKQLPPPAWGMWLGIAAPHLCSLQAPL